MRFAKGERVWDVSRRYSDFLRLRTNIQCVFPDVWLPELPTKLTVPGANSDDGFVERRRQQLQSFLQTLISFQSQPPLQEGLPVYFHCPDFGKFVFGGDSRTHTS